MLVSLKSIVADAYADGYAVGAFNCLSLENVEGAVRAAEELDSPIILQLAEVQFPYAPMEKMLPMFVDAAHRSCVPVAVHLDHGFSFQTCAQAIRLGATSVMIDGSTYPLEENIRITREVVQMANAFGVDVEAELGKVGDTDSVEGMMTANMFTDVEESIRFVRETGITALAVSIGNLHGKYTATPNLNIHRVKEIKDRNPIPLVLHGGTGTSKDDFKACIHHGISKINVATAIQLRVMEKVRDYLANDTTPGYIGMKYKMIEASKEVVADHIRLFESVGKAKRLEV